MGKRRMANVKPEKNDMGSSVKRKERRPSVGKVLDGKEFIR